MIIVLILVLILLSNTAKVTDRTSTCTGKLHFNSFLCFSDALPPIVSGGSSSILLYISRSSNTNIKMILLQQK